MNPPWEHTELKEKEWFAVHKPDILAATTGAQRKQSIDALGESEPELHKAFVEAKRSYENLSHFIRNSGKYPLCGRGRVNTYAIFAELVRQIQAQNGRIGIILPSGIATDDTTKYYFQQLSERSALVSLYDFENRNKLFPAVDSRMKFCLLTLRGEQGPVQAPAEFVFFAHAVEDLQETERRFTLTAAEIALLNPNTRTCPTFRSRRDAELTKSIYRRVPVLIREETPEQNPWKIHFRQGLFNMTSDSHLFRTQEALEAERLERNVYQEQQRYLPLYEAKMFHHFDHRWATYEGGETQDVTSAEKKNEQCVVLPRYWVAEQEVQKRIDPKTRWLLAFRDICRSTDERTAIFTAIPAVAVGHKAPILLSEKFSSLLPVLQTALSSYIFDYLARQSVGGTSLAFYIVKQLPVLPPEAYAGPCPWDRGCTVAGWLQLRVLELTYTAWDLQPFAQDCGYDGPPFRWEEARRFLLRCELDAAHFHLYGIEREDVAYILDTFPIVARKESAIYGEYRTRRVVLEIYDALAAAMRTGEPYASQLEPPPAAAWPGAHTFRNRISGRNSDGAGQSRAWATCRWR